MIDIENKVYTMVKSVLPVGTNTSSVRVKIPKSFPHVAIIEEDNSVHLETKGLCDTENYADVMYTVDIFSDKTKAECKTLAGLVDAKMTQMGFTKTVSQSVENVDESVYRYVLRFEATVSAGRTIGNNTVHFIQ